MVAHFAAAAACRESWAVPAAGCTLAPHKASRNPFRKRGRQGEGQGSHRGLGHSQCHSWERASDEEGKKNNFLVVYKKSPFLRSICLNQLSFVPSADELIKITFCIKSGR